ncbi:MAG TPA: ATP-binding cassette domain-containing protein [Actinomycetota bacterium]
MTAPVLRAIGLEKSYRRGSETVHALAGVDLVLAPGELVALTGRSGSGKSTLLNALAGWEAPDTGTIEWTLREGGGPVPWRELAILPQSLGLIEELSVRGNVELPARLAGTRDESAERVDQLLGHLGLRALADRTPAETSLGEQQRAALARALVLEPDVLLIDEPTGHQDATWAARVISALNVAAGEGTGCLVATHSHEVSEFASRIVHIDDGRIVD